MVDPRDGLTPRQRLAVDLLARGHTCRHVARELGVTERTIHTYRKKPAVMTAVLRAQEDYMSEGGGQGVSSVPEAVQTLTKIMNDPQARDSDRIAASRALMNGAVAYQERKMLERKIRDLEALLIQLTGSPPEYEEDTTPIDFEALDPLLPSAAVPEGAA
jgi:hypothetical protein